jgi:predicted DNA binding CopG/RHH family protein
MNNKTSVTVRMPNDLLADIKRRAHEQRRSTSQQIILYVEKSLKADLAAEKGGLHEGSNKETISV